MLIHSSATSKPSFTWKAAIRTIVGAAYYYSGLFGLHLKVCRRRRRAVILMLHRVLPSESPVLKQHLALRPLITSQENLLALIQFLKKHFQFMSLPDYIGQAENRDSSQAPACIFTFDDGYLDFSQYAWPALKANGIPATMFLPTALIGTAHRFWWDRLYHAAIRFKGPIPEAISDEKKKILKAIANASLVDRAKHVYKLIELAQDWNPTRVEILISRLRNSEPAAEEAPTEANALMNWADVRALQQSGVHFGSHTRHHLNLKTATPEQLLDEVNHSKRELEAALQSEVTSFSFPGGHIPQQALENLTASGYTDACTTQAGLSRPEDGVFHLRRVSVWDGALQDSRGRFSPGIFALNLTRSDWF